MRPIRSLRSFSSTQGWSNTRSGCGRGTGGVITWYGAFSPNDGHRALAAWQDHADVEIVTQNVDDLHERAGSGYVHHLHGSLACRLRSVRRRIRGTAAGDARAGVSGHTTAVWVRQPDCSRHRVVREALPSGPWDACVDAALGADLLVVVGTSSIVYPAAGLPELALARGTVVVEVNPEPTPLSASATISIRESASTALPVLLQLVAGPCD